MTILFGVIIPYIAGFLFIFGLLYRIWKWGGSPVPFRITTTCGQEKSLPWIKSSYLDNPHNTLGVIGRMALEVLAFRSLFRNTSVEIKQKTQRLIYSHNIALWLAAIVFHWALLIILLRHLRYVMLSNEGVPFLLKGLSSIDGVFEWSVPTIYLSSIGFVLALGYLLFRRIADSRMRFISLPSDYIPLLLLFCVIASGFLMVFFWRVDLTEVKELAISVVTFHPITPAEGIGWGFYLHLFLFCTLLAYFPFSKLVHMAGIFLSPTRNLANNNRMKRHINPWNYPVKVHTYEEYEDEFRDLMRASDLPLDKE